MTEKNCSCKCNLDCPIKSRSINLETLPNLCSDCIDCLQIELAANKNYRRLGFEDETDYLKKLMNRVEEEIQERLSEIDGELRQ